MTIRRDRVLRTLNRAANAYPGGLPALYVVVEPVGKLQTFRNKLSDSNEEHRLYLDEALEIIKVTGDLSPLDEMEREHGRVAVAMEGWDGTSDTDLIAALGKIDTEKGEMVATMIRILEDGRVTRDELACFEKEALDVARAIVETVQRMRSLADD